MRRGVDQQRLFAQDDCNALQNACSELERDILRHSRNQGLLRADMQTSTAASEAIKTKLGTLDKDVSPFNYEMQFSNLPLSAVIQIYYSSQI